MADLNQEDIMWLIAVNRFNGYYQAWVENPNKHRIPPALLERLDLVYRVIKRMLETLTPTAQNRERVHTQFLLLSFLSGFAEVELGASPEGLFL